jgi:Pyridoxamine 5'-phosphate oxidase
MAKQFARIEAIHHKFILQQHVFFAASAAAEGRVNVSPKDGAALRILSPNRVAYLDQTGSGNETAAHLRAHGRLTLMFCAFAGAPLILRLYGQGRALPRGGLAYSDLLASAFSNEERPGSRQIVVLDIDLVQTSCGYGVPLFEYVAERPTLTRWAEAKGETGLEEYRQSKNAFSIDGLPTGILESSQR